MVEIVGGLALAGWLIVGAGFCLWTLLDYAGKQWQRVRAWWAR